MDRWELIKKINDEADIVSLVSEYVKLEKFGNNYRGLCPFHDEKTPSFSVSPEKKIAYCFGCKQGGSALKFYQEIENISQDEAIKRLCIKYGIKESLEQKQFKNKSYYKFENIMNETTNFYQYNLENSKQGLDAIKYLDNRLIDKKMRNLLKIGLAPKENIILNLFKNQNIDELSLLDLGLIVNDKNKQYRDLFKNRIVFPILDEDGLIVGFSGRVYYESDEPKYLNSPESIIFKKREVLYNLYYAKEEIKKQKFVYLVEGFMDVIAFLKAGIKNVVCTMGTVFTKEHLKIIQKYTNNIVISYDGDLAGINATNKLIDDFKDENIIFEILRFPDNLDPDEYLKKYGDIKFSEFINNKLDIYEYQFDRLKSNLNKNNVFELDNFKKEIYKLIKDSKSTIVLEKYLNKLSNFINLDYDILKNDLNRFLKQGLNNNKNKTIEKKEIKSNKFISRYLEAEKYVIQYMMYNKEYAYAIDNEINDVVDDRNFKIKMKIINFHEEHLNFDKNEFINYLDNDLKEYFIQELNEINCFNREDAYKYYKELLLYSDKLRIDEINKQISLINDQDEIIKLINEKNTLLKKIKRN